MPTLDFIVIGAQKAGTTSLWQYLRGHPRLCMPTFKEATFFTMENAYLNRLENGMRLVFADAPPDSLLGKVTPEYMIGGSVGPVERVAERIHSAFPEVKLISLLRDPVERAVSSYTMAVRRGQEQRSVDVALSESLEPEALAAARLRPEPTNSYVTAGEYGRVVGVYRDVFPAEQLQVLFTEELADDPGALLDRLLGYLGLPIGFRPEDLELRHFRSGARKLLDPESERLLRRFHEEEVLPRMRGPAMINKAMFDFFYQIWNVARDDEPPSLSVDVRVRLEEHFRLDAERLTGLGVPAPWIARWASRDQ